jgi:hypothetical protein
MSLMENILHIPCGMEIHYGISSESMKMSRTDVLSLNNISDPQNPGRTEAEDKKKKLIRIREFWFHTFPPETGRA